MCLFEIDPDNLMLVPTLRALVEEPDVLNNADIMLLQDAELVTTTEVSLDALAPPQRREGGAYMLSNGAAVFVEPSDSGKLVLKLDELLRQERKRGAETLEWAIVLADEAMERAALSDAESEAIDWVYDARRKAASKVHP